MQIGDASWREIVRQDAADFGVRPTASQLEKLAVHAAELIRWNRKINLTRVTRPEDVAVRHVVDSLALVPHLSACRRVLDIGSGGGYPGLVVSAMLPPCPVVMMDSVRKKISFLKHVSRLIGAEQADAVHARAEDLADHPDFGGRFDAVTCRALSDLPACLELARPFLGKTGALFAMRGATGEEEASALRAAPIWAKLTRGSMGKAVMECIAYELPRGTGRRHLVVIRPAAAAV
jgi:16S rRNA (guanine527-N7)-methyltransferase